MKKNVIFKKIIIILLILFLFTTVIFNNYTIEAATGFDSVPLGNFDKGKEELEISNVTGTMDSVIATVMTVVRTVSVAIAIVMLLVIGMKYMIASPGERADIKKHAIAYVIGAFILFGVSGILTMLLTFGEQIGGGETTGP